MYRLGNADIGVSILFLLSLYASRFWFDVGGGGRAKGLGGPDAPADMTAEALGEGGGNTIWSELLAGLAEALAVCDGDPPAAESLSSASEGICRLSLGRAPDFDPDVFVLEGGANSGTVGWERAGCELGRGGAGAVILRGGGLMSAKSSSLFVRGLGSGAPKKCWARTEPPSSIGVNILLDFDDKCLSRGGEACSGGRRLCDSG